MLRQSLQFHRAALPQVRQRAALHALNVRSMYPLIGGNNLLPQIVRHYEDYQGRRAVDSDHDLPVLSSKRASNYLSTHHVWTNWDKKLNPQLISGPDTLRPQDEFVAPRSGNYLPHVGWMRIGGSWRFKNKLTKQRNKLYARDYQWLETNVTPRWRAVPRIGDINPQARYAGKLEFLDLPLSKVIWAIDSQRLDRNAVITLWSLREAEVIREEEIVWPGVRLVDDLPRDAKLRYPVSLELQSGSVDAIRRVEKAGGSFVSAYMSIDGLYQTMHPEEYPVFIDQHMPERMGMQNVAVSDQARGYLCRWFENQAKYADVRAGRRLSHYVAPPTDRDYPATWEEFSRVQHHQRWHLNQSGTGTVLPFVSNKSLEDMPRSPTILQGN